jgi:predicted nucleic acid-binding protein
MSKNDLWMAATASVLDTTLLTTDNDFEHLHNEFLQVAKIDLVN